MTTGTFNTRLSTISIIHFIVTGLFLAVLPLVAQADLAASDTSDNSIALYWTAPGDDGNQGTAAIYDIRYSASMITESNWDSVTQVVGEPVPQLAGSPEIFTVQGLQPGTAYYFAIKAADEVANWSSMSNVVCDTTQQESVPPATVADLGAIDSTGNSVTLVWTAPGDDGTHGQASQYDIRYSTLPITHQNWNSATQVSGEPAPGPSGSQETFTVAGLQQEATYYFALKTADEIPNWSALSNVVSATTPDEVPPATINDLSALTGENLGEIAIAWTAPGDDSASGVASAYVIKVYEQLITDSTWDLAFVISDPPAPLAGGSPQSWVISGLDPGSLYYIGMKAVDNYSNVSGLSNVDSAVAQSSQDVDIFAGLPEEYALFQNYPNPFNASTTIGFALRAPAEVTLQIFDNSGRLVTTIYAGPFPAGYHSLQWNARSSGGQDSASGMYLCQIQANDFSQTKKMTLVR